MHRERVMETHPEADIEFASLERFSGVKGCFPIASDHPVSVITPASIFWKACDSFGVAACVGYLGACACVHVCSRMCERRDHRHMLRIFLSHAPPPYILR